jgi:hypothetical protein
MCHAKCLVVSLGNSSQQKQCHLRSKSTTTGSLLTPKLCRTSCSELSDMTITARIRTGDPHIEPCIPRDQLPYLYHKSAAYLNVGGQYHPAGPGRAYLPFRTHSISAVPRNSFTLATPIAPLTPAQSPVQARRGLPGQSVSPPLRRGLHQRLPLPPRSYWHQPTCPCHHLFCGSHIQGSDVDHAMSSNRLRGSRLRQHDHWKKSLSRISPVQAVMLIRSPVTLLLMLQPLAIRGRGPTLK